MCGRHAAPSGRRSPSGRPITAARLSRVPTAGRSLPVAARLRACAGKKGALTGQPPHYTTHTQASAREVARLAASELQSRLGSEALPLAKVVPLVSGVAQEAMAPASPAIPAIARLEGVRALAAAVYSCGLPF